MNAVLTGLVLCVSFACLPCAEERNCCATAVAQ